MTELEQEIKKLPIGTHIVVHKDKYGVYRSRLVGGQKTVIVSDEDLLSAVKKFNSLFS